MTWGNSFLYGIRHAFFDLDGTIYRGDALLPGAKELLTFLQETGRGLTYVTNNSSFSTPEYQERLARLGLPAESRHFYTSVSYAIDVLKRQPEVHALYLLAVPSVRKEFVDAGFTEDERHPDAVVIAFDRSLTYDRLSRAATLMRHGVPAFATHPDFSCPAAHGDWLVDCGAITACLEAASGRRAVRLGKPDPGLLRTAAERIGIPVNRTLMVGDRLSTDIAVGLYAGAHTCRILLPDADDEDMQGIVPDLEVRAPGELLAIWRQATSNKKTERIPSMTHFISHRGESLDAPENSLSSFRLAMDRDADGMETDIHLTSDGVLICCHNADTQAVSGISKVIEQTTFAELRKLDISGAKTAYRGERLPTFREALALLKPGKTFFVEIKENDPAVLTAMRDDLAASGVPEHQIVMISFHAGIVAASKTVMPRVRTQWLTGSDLPLPSILSTLKDVRADGVDIYADRDAVTPEFVQTLHGAGYEVNVWTVDDETLCQAFLQAGVDEITSNRAAELKTRFA